MPKWSEQVRICSGTMADGPLGDGYSWRKYGQKDILGATHPRCENLAAFSFSFSLDIESSLLFSAFIFQKGHLIVQIVP